MYVAARERLTPSRLFQNHQCIDVTILAGEHTGIQQYGFRSLRGYLNHKLTLIDVKVFGKRLKGDRSCGWRAVTDSAIGLQ